MIEETEISKTDFFFAPVFQTCWDLLEENGRREVELSPVFSWMWREKATYTQGQLIAMSLTERMARFSTSQFVPVSITYSLHAREGLMSSIAFDALIDGKQGSGSHF